VAIRHFLTEALKKEEGVATKKDEEREKEGRKEGKRAGFIGVETTFRAIEHGAGSLYLTV